MAYLENTFGIALLCNSLFLFSCWILQSNNLQAGCQQKSALWIQYLLIGHRFYANDEIQPHQFEQSSKKVSTPFSKYVSRLRYCCAPWNFFVFELSFILQSCKRRGLSDYRRKTPSKCEDLATHSICIWGQSLKIVSNNTCLAVLLWVYSSLVFWQESRHYFWGLEYPRWSLVSWFNHQDFSLSTHLDVGHGTSCVERGDWSSRNHNRKSPLQS